MFHPKLRRALAATALVSALSLLPIRHAGAEPRALRVRGGRAVAERIAVRPASFWDFLMRLLAKASVRIDPNGSPSDVWIDPKADGNS